MTMPTGSRSSNRRPDRAGRHGRARYTLRAADVRTFVARFLGSSEPPFRRNASPAPTATRSPATIRRHRLGDDDGARVAVGDGRERDDPAGAGDRDPVHRRRRPNALAGTVARLTYRGRPHDGDPRLRRPHARGRGRQRPRRAPRLARPRPHRLRHPLPHGAARHAPPSRPWSRRAREPVVEEGAPYLPVVEEGRQARLETTAPYLLVVEEGRQARLETTAVPTGG